MVFVIYFLWAELYCYYFASLASHSCTPGNSYHHFRVHNCCQAFFHSITHPRRLKLNDSSISPLHGRDDSGSIQVTLFLVEAFHP